VGPDALGLRRAELAGLLAGRRGAVKAALMDQAVVAGLGNLLVDEILWRARIHPRRPAARIDDGELGRLQRAMHGVLHESVRHGRVPPKPGWLTGVRDDRGARCPRCRAVLERGRLGGRTARWCPRCQPD
jgi:formamidopyrimidine-DNA glycosylase